MEKAFITAVAILLVLDLIWISLNKSSYASATRKVQGKPMKTNIQYIAVSYMIVFLGLYLIMGDVRHYKSLSTRLLRTALWGFVIYGVYNSVNAALFTDYDIAVAVKDTLWGCFVIMASVNGALYLT
jgi:uncharacterized membrane protein